MKKTLSLKLNIYLTTEKHSQLDKTIDSSKLLLSLHN